MKKLTTILKEIQVDTTKIKYIGKEHVNNEIIYSFKYDVIWMFTYDELLEFIKSKKLTKS